MEDWKKKGSSEETKSVIERERSCNDRKSVEEENPVPSDSPQLVPMENGIQNEQIFELLDGEL